MQNQVAIAPNAQTEPIKAISRALPHYDLGNFFRSGFTMRLNIAAVLAASVISCSAMVASFAAPLWTDIDTSRVALRGERQIVPTIARTMTLNYVGMTRLLEAAPLESNVAAPDSAFEIELPMPEGGFERFRVVESPVMAPELAARYSSIKTYLAQGIDTPSTTARFDLTSRGFRAQVIANTHTTYIEPYQQNDVGSYIVFNKADYPLDR
jgi:hypothetical protein